MVVDFAAVVVADVATALALAMEQLAEPPQATMSAVTNEIVDSNVGQHLVVVEDASSH